MIHEYLRLTMACDREGCKTTLKPEPRDEWNPAVFAEQARKIGWGVRDFPAVERHLCPQHEATRP